MQLPLKMSKPVDISRPIFGYIQSKYSKEDCAALSDVLPKLQQMRINATSVSSCSAASENALIEYYQQLVLLESRFPISESNVRIISTYSSL